MLIGKYLVSATRTFINRPRYFDHLSPRTSMERSNLFIQTSPALFQDGPEEMLRALSPLNATDVIVRRERQTFTRLPKSNAVLFTVKTYMVPLVELGDEELLALRSQLWGWEEEIRAYTGWGVWGEKVEAHCEERLGKRDESVKVAKGGCPV
jgi:hypothetical protein